MKTIYSILLTMLLLVAAKGADPISTDQFKKMIIAEQEKALAQAPTEMKPELQKIHQHSCLVADCGGEAGLKERKENRIIEEKGLAFVKSRFETECTLRAEHIGATLVANKKSGMSQEKQAEVQKLLEKKLSALVDQCHLVHQLLLRVAASPEASALGKKAENREIEIRKQYNLGLGTPEKPTTEEQLSGLETELDQLLQEIKSLSTLTDEQAQKQIDDFPEDKVITQLNTL